MTKRKQTTRDQYSPLQWAQLRLRVLAIAMREDKPLPSGDKKFLADALERIADGEDPEAVLGVKAKRGERKTANAQATAFRQQALLSFIAAVMCPPPDGYGYSLEKAIQCATEDSPGEADFGYSEDTVRNLATNNLAKRETKFLPPSSNLANKIVKIRKTK